MTQDKSLATTESDERATTLLLPSRGDIDDLIGRAEYLSEKLAEVVAKRKWYAVIEGKQYLEVEAWQFIGLQAGLDSDIEWTVPIRDEANNIIAYESKAILYRRGEQFSSGIMRCGMNSFPTGRKKGQDRDKAAQSASQTWAISKAYRNRLGFIARLAGYEATPADEMERPREQTVITLTSSSNNDIIERELPPELDTTDGYACPLAQHTGMSFTERTSKNGKSTWWSHPIDSGGWCNAKGTYEGIIRETGQVLRWSEERVEGYKADFQAQPMARQVELIKTLQETTNIPEPSINQASEAEQLDYDTAKFE